MTNGRVTDCHQEAYRVMTNGNITDWHHEAYRVVTNGDSDGRIFISHPHTINIFFLAHL